MNSLLKAVRRDFAPDKSWYSPEKAGGVLAIRHRDERVFLFRDKARFEWCYSDLISAEMDRTYSENTQRSGGRSLIGFAAGGLLLGPAGAIIGGLGGKRKVTTTTYLTGVFLKLGVAEQRNTSLISFCFYSGTPSSMQVSVARNAEMIADDAAIQFRHLVRSGTPISDRQFIASSESNPGLSPPESPTMKAPVSTNGKTVVRADARPQFRPNQERITRAKANPVFLPTARANTNPAAQTRLGNTTPLHEAAHQRHISLAQFAFERGGDVNACDEKGRTPLHIAVENDDGEMIRLLLKMGAVLDVHDVNGETPVDRVKRAGSSMQILIR